MPYTEIPAEELKSSDASLSSIASLQRDEQQYNGNDHHGYHQELYYHHQHHNSDHDNSTNSSLRSIEEFEEDANVAGYLPPIYHPIVIPTEPTLEELLKRVSGQNDLNNVESLKLRVISYVISLSRLSSYTPKLTSLNLDGSVLSSLRDLGCDLNYLRYLNVSNCGLSSLDGTCGIPSIECLIADGNMIEIVTPLGNLLLLKKLSLKDNRIRDLCQLSFLGLCPLLSEINLEGNSCTKNILYRLEMFRNVQSLELLDGRSFDEEQYHYQQQQQHNQQHQHEDVIQNSSESDEAISSLSIEEGLSSRENEISSDNNREQMEIMQQQQEQRPSTSHGVCRVIIRKELSNRPNSADQQNTKLLSSGDPLCGSVVSAIRKQRNQKVSSAWGASGGSSYSSSSSASLNSADDKNFPIQISQATIDLELGVVGSNALSGTSTFSNIENSNNLRKIANKWKAESLRKKCDLKNKI